MLFEPFVLVHALLEFNDVFGCQLSKKLTQIAQFLQVLDVLPGYELINLLSHIFNKSIYFLELGRLQSLVLLLHIFNNLFFVFFCICFTISLIFETVYKHFLLIQRDLGIEVHLIQELREMNRIDYLLSFNIVMR